MNKVSLSAPGRLRSREKDAVRIRRMQNAFLERHERHKRFALEVAAACTSITDSKAARMSDELLQQ